MFYGRDLIRKRATLNIFNDISQKNIFKFRSGKNITGLFMISLLSSSVMIIDRFYKQKKQFIIFEKKGRGLDPWAPPVVACLSNYQLLAMQEHSTFVSRVCSYPFIMILLDVKSLGKISIIKHQQIFFEPLRRIAWVESHYQLLLILS